MAIKPIDHYSLTNPASVYDEEALTALELAGRTAAKVNETVEAFNELKAQTNAHLTAQDDDIAQKFAQQDIEIDRRADEQDRAIPKKVDEVVNAHIDDGDFDAAIDRNIGNLGARVGVVENRVDNLVSNTPSGGTTMDTEIIDARTSVNGKTYGNLRAAIHGEIDRAINDTPIYDRVNRFNPNTVVTGHYIEVNGSLQPNEGHNASDFMRVKAGEMIHFNYDCKRAFATFVYFYDEGKTIMSGYKQNVAQVYVPNGAYFMRVCHSATLYPNEFLFMVSAPFFDYKKVLFNDSFDYDADSHAMYCGVYANRFDPTKGIAGAYVSFEDGRTIPEEVAGTYFTTNMIPIHRGEKLKICDRLMNKLNVRMVAYYNDKFEFLYGEENKTTVAPDGDYIAYARFALDYTTIVDTIICRDDQTVWVEYGEFIANAPKQIENLTGGAFATIREPLKGDSLYNNTMHLGDFPHYIKNNHSVSFSCRFPDEFKGIVIGRGRDNNVYGGLIFTITPTKMQIQQKHNNSVSAVETVNFGFTITEFLMVTITYTDNKATITIISKGGYITHTVERIGLDAGLVSVYFQQLSYSPKLSVTCADLEKPLWLIGDSYFGFNDDRVVGALRKMGFKNYLTMGMSGLNSSQAYDDFVRALNYGTPKYVVWYLGMNDGASVDTYSATLQKVITKCRERGITLIVNRVPTVPTVNNEEIAAYVVNTNLRYIDSYDAVGADSTGAWVDGAISTDGVHPTEYGATLLAARMLVDVPEIMSYGKE